MGFGHCLVIHCEMICHYRVRVSAAQYCVLSRCKKGTLNVQAKYENIRNGKQVG